MGLIVDEVIFDGQAPSAKCIADQVTHLTGLPVTLQETGPEIREDCHDLHALLAFERYPDIQVELMAYHSEGVEKFLQQTGISDLPLRNSVQGTSEPPGTQTIHLRYLGQELTLLRATVRALESLGGRALEPRPEVMRRETEVRISIQELERRHQKAQRRVLLVLFVFVASLPVLIPLWIGGLAWFVITIPWKIRQSLRRMSEGRGQREVHPVDRDARSGP